MTLLALVIEDDQTLHGIFQHLLQKAGFNTVCLKNGVEAGEYLHDHTPQLVFLDMLLPHLHGIDLLRWMRQDGRFVNTRIVVVSSIEHYEREVIREEFFLKPMQAKSILRIAQETMASFAGTL